MKTGVDLFSGAGGMSLGAKLAGISTVCAVEKDAYSAETFAYNNPNAHVIDRDIREVDFKKEAVRPFVLYGGPPCQGFSTSNTKTRNLRNAKNHLFTEFVRAIEELQPQWVIFENVEGITTLKKGVVIDQLKEAIKEVNREYKFKDGVLKASDYGVPQARKRYFLVANLNNIDFEFPIAFDYEVTVAEAIADLPKLKNGEKLDSASYSQSAISQYAKLLRGKRKKSLQNLVSCNADYVIERYKHIPQGGNWSNIPEELMTNYTNRQNCHSGIYKRLDENKPSCVISNYRKNMLIHPRQNRGLSVREAARLQSFPDSFVFKGPLISIQQQIGNAVPPLLAKAIFDQILSYDE